MPAVLVAGAGRVAERCYIPAAIALGSRVLLHDTDRDRAEALARTSGRRVTAASSLDAALDEPSVTLAVVATSPASHGDVVAAVAGGARERGRELPILIEKPPVTTERDLARLSTLDTPETPLKCAWIRRTHGTLRSARPSFNGWRDRYGPLRRVCAVDGSLYKWRPRSTPVSVALDQVPHMLDTLAFIAGPMRFSRADAAACDVGAFTATARGRLDGGDEFDLRLEVSHDRPRPNAVDLVFEQGAVRVEHTEAGIVTGHAGQRTELINAGDASSPRGPQRFRQLLTAARANDSSSEPSPLGTLAEWGPLLGLLLDWTGSEIT